MHRVRLISPGFLNAPLAVFLDLGEAGFGRTLRREEGDPIAYTPRTLVGEYLAPHLQIIQRSEHHDYWPEAALAGILNKVLRHVQYIFGTKVPKVAHEGLVENLPFRVVACGGIRFEPVGKVARRQYGDTSPQPFGRPRDRHAVAVEIQEGKKAYVHNHSGLGKPVFCQVVEGYHDSVVQSPVGHVAVQSSPVKKNGGEPVFL